MRNGMAAIFHTEKISFTFPSLKSQGSFKALCIFSSLSEHIYKLIKESCPEIMRCEKGRLKCQSLPSLTHIFWAGDHMHAGVFTFSDLLSRKVDLSILPSLDSFDPHTTAAFVQSMGSTGDSRLAAVSQYQLLGGARSVNHAFRITAGDSVCVCLPLHRGALLSLLCLSPFLSHCTLFFPDAEPLPAKVFQCISYYNLSVLLSNGAALRLLLKIYQRTRAPLHSLLKILLIGERVSTELRTAIRQTSPHTQLIAVGYVLSETASIPIMGDHNVNISKVVGRSITGFTCKIKRIEGCSSSMGILLLSPFAGSTFLGYAPSFAPSIEEENKWIDTGDVAEMDGDGNIHIICPTSDLIYDEKGTIFNHKPLERILVLSNLIKGAQIIAYPPSSFIAVCVPKKVPFDSQFLKAELSLMCRETGMKIPPFFAFLEDFPRTNTRVQKFKLRELLAEGKLELI